MSQWAVRGPGSRRTFSAVASWRPARGGGVNEPAGSLDGDADGLFDLDVEAGFQAGDTEPMVQKVRGANVRRVAIGRRQQVGHVAKDGRRVLLPRRCGGGNLLRRREVGVTDGGKLEQVRLRRADRGIAAQMRPCDPAAADQGQFYGHAVLPIGAGLRGPSAQSGVGHAGIRQKLNQPGGAPVEAVD